MGPWTSPDETGFGSAPFFCIGAGFPYGIIVDPETSKRFVNELGNRYERSMAIIKLGHPVICITDADGANHSLEKDLQKLEPAVKAFGSIKELSLAYEMDADTLRQTIEEYNTGVTEGKDEFGQIVTPPFYASRLWPKVHFCCGGVQINPLAQIMHIDGYPIKGLFAAGEITGGVHGADRLGSCSTLDCLAFGRIAGNSVVTNKCNRGRTYS
jgi:succinate dehydrogenase/fumarate reductase flavoprotein subunit